MLQLSRVDYEKQAFSGSRCSIEIVPISEEKGEIIKVTNEIGENIPASKLIEDFFYVPLESIEESLFAYCNQIEVFEDKIFVFDRTGTEKLFIFRKNGKFLKSIGEKGGAPFEFFKPRSFAIDREKSKLLFMTIRNGSGCIFL